MKTSRKGLEFIAAFESFRSRLYNDAANHATIGFGHLVHKGPINGSEPEEFKRGISLERAYEILALDAADAEEEVNRKVKVLTDEDPSNDLTQDQFDALVSLVFNIGDGNFERSTVLLDVNGHNFADVPRALALWNKAGGKELVGLTKRRHAEGEAFKGEA
jgi:lysozyme